MNNFRDMKPLGKFINYRKYLLLYLVIFFILLEILCRILFPYLGEDIFQKKKESPFLYSQEFCYALKPGAILESRLEKDKKVVFAQVNKDGFLGPVYPEFKPEGVLRILAIGDSTVQGLPVVYQKRWLFLLQRLINRYYVLNQINKRSQLINAGIGGYVAWQAAWQLKRLAPRYNPDLVLVLVGINNMFILFLLYGDRGFV